MEYQENNTSMFGLSINDTAQSYLKTAAKWERFLAWVNIIVLGLCILFFVLGGSAIKDIMNARSYSTYGTNSSYSNSGLTFALIFYAVIYAVMMVPNFYRLFFANKCIKAIDNKDEEQLTASFKHLKTYSIFWGVLTIIGLVLMLLFIVVVFVATTR